MTNSVFQCFAHRGASGHAPENTLKAFEKAIELGCHWVELDVYLVENEIIVIHDDELARTTNGHGAVMDASLDYLRSLDAGDGEQIPLLKEVIQLIDHRVNINIELKGADTALAVNALLAQLCDSRWSPVEFLISSFNHKQLALADPAYCRGALMHRKVHDYFQRTTRLSAYSINLSIKAANEAMVRQAHDLGLKVYVYTVNDGAEMQALKAMGVDGVFTDFPDRFPW